MASVNSPRGLVLARKNGQGSNSTGVTMIPVGDNISPIVPSAALPTSMFTGDPIMIYGAGTIIPTGANPTHKSAGVFQGCSYVDGNGNQIFSNINGGDGAFCAVNQQDDRFRYVSSQYLNMRRQSNTGTRNISRDIRNAVGGNDGVWFINPFEIMSCKI